MMILPPRFSALLCLNRTSAGKRNVRFPATSGHRDGELRALGGGRAYCWRGRSCLLYPDDNIAKLGVRWQALSTAKAR